MKSSVCVVGSCRAALLLLCLSVLIIDGPTVFAVEQVVVVFKTHFDIGYTDMASNVVTRYRTSMIDQALDVCDQNRDLPPEQQFVWTLPGWPMARIAEAWAGQKPERRERILGALRDGRFAVHAFPFTTHTELLELEDLVRGLDFSTLLSKELALPLPRDAKMTDVPCHSWILPTLLAHSGVKFLHLGCNAASSSPRVPRLFWWEGPDGSRLMTMYSSESYGTGLVPPADWPLRTWLALIHTGDNHGPPTPPEVKQLLDQARTKLPGVKLRIGRLSDFADAVLAEKAELPVVRGDMPDTWIHGPMSDPAGAKLARTIRPSITTAEVLATSLAQWGVNAPESGPAISQAYEQSLLYGEHTWGGALYWVTSYSSDRKFHYGDLWKNEVAGGRFRRLEGSWAEHTAYIEKTRDLVTPALHRGLNALVTAVNVAGPRIVVYNPLPWPRDGWVSIPATGDWPGLKPAESGEVVPVQRTPKGIEFLAKNIPALGYRTFVRTASRQGGQLLKWNKDGTVQTPYFTAKLDPAQGVMRSLVDASGREWIDSNAPHGFGQYLYERFDSNQVAAYVRDYVKIKADWAINELGKPAMPSAKAVPYRATVLRDFQMSFQEGPGSLTVTMNVPQAVTTTFRFYEDAKWVDLEMTVHNKSVDPWPEAGWLCFPVRSGEPRFYLGRLGSIIDPARDIVPGANRNLFGLNTGFAVVGGDGAGLGFCAIDNPLVSLETPGCWKYSREFVPRKPIAFVNLFNNQWTTNFRLWNQGTWSSRVRFWVFNRYSPEASLISPSLEARYPLQALAADGPGGKIAPSNMGVELSRRGILVTALGPSASAGGTVLRLWELAGQTGKLDVHLPAWRACKSVQPVNLRGEPMGKPIPMDGGQFSSELPAYTPASFVLSTP